MSDSLVGGTIDTRYEVRRLIARGGIGLVFEAQHRITRRIVAVKLLAEDLRASREARARLRREALALTLVRHTGFVEGLDAGVCGEHGPYVVMEMLDGRSLDGILAARQRLSIEDAVEITLQVCAATAHAHAQGVLHRDLKPANFFLARSEQGGEVVKVIDLGVAAVRAEQLEGRDPEITGQGTPVGTPEYMAPEQLFGGEVDVRADVYAIGASLFEFLTGDVPHPGSYEKVVAQLTKSATTPRVRYRRPEVSIELANVIETALAKDPSARHASVSDLARLLARATGPSPGRSALLPAFGLTPGTPDAGRPERAIELVRKKPYVGAAARSGGPEDGAQDRQHIRVPYVTPVVLSTSAGDMEARCEEISDGGMLVVSAAALEEGASIEVRFATPIVGEMVLLRASVRWVTANRSRCAMGLEFDEPSASLRRTLAEYAHLFPGRDGR